jgi:protoporphyrinogen oxidase
MSDDELTDRCLRDIEPLVPDARERFLGAHVLKTPLAYPVFHVDYEEHRRRLAKGTGVQGLYSVGRNGEFDHLLMEDVYCRTTDRARAIAHSLAS